VQESAFQLVRLASGVHSIRCGTHGETFHPVVGPAAEAGTLYAAQFNLGHRIPAGGEFVFWDVGTGAAANVMALLHAAPAKDATLRIVSFDRTLDALRFAIEHRDDLGYFGDFQEHATVIANGATERAFTLDGGLRVVWQMNVGDFPARLVAHRFPPPHAIAFDPFSPARNPNMWTLDLFTALHHQLDPARPCALATYSRSTFIRVALLLAGFYVGAGAAVAEKEETTIAANALQLIQRPLTARWLARARRSHSAEPLEGGTYRQAPLGEATWEALRNHPQFR